MTDLKSELAARALELGFSECRVARSSVPPHAAEFGQWLAAGNAGEMSWMERNQERRTDPDQVLPGARSVVVLAMNYWQGDGEQTGGSFQAARYAWGDDYHEVIEERLGKLDEWLTAHGGKQRCYVDTGPVLERDFAARAGLGWHGKSTMLISGKLGTWYFLAEILTTLDLPPDEPAKDRCGSCTRCITACPTGAITSPYHLDARRCVSYLTIELKGSIPEDLRPLIGDRIYGCDDCLTACPWNRFARKSRESAFAARDWLRKPLAALLEMTSEEFSRVFRKSPVKRVKRRGFLRNVCVALGNTGAADDIPALERAARDPEPLIQEHAKWALEQIARRTHNPPAGPRPV